MDVSGEIALATERLVRRFRPVRVVLFGSRARGEARPDSDIDLLLVLPACDDLRAAVDAAQVELRGIGRVDGIVITTPDEIARRGNLVGTVLRPALREGVVLYADAYPDMRCGVAEGEIEQEVRRWLRWARTDLDDAELLARRGEAGARNACYHAQQAAEKAIKAVLIFLQCEFPFVHDLDDLVALVPEDWRLKEEFPDLEPLSRWAVAGRYPSALAEPGEQESAQAMEEARAVLAAVSQKLSEHGFEPAEDEQGG